MSPAIHVAPTVASTRARILIVDDAQDDREMYATFLTNIGGCEVTQAATGLEALAVFAREKPDVIVLDVRLPELDGAEICRRLRRTGENDHTAVVALTAMSPESASVRDMITAGSNAVLIKPCLPDRLLAEIRRLVAQGRTLRAHGVRQNERAAALRTRSERLHERSRKTHEMAHELLQKAQYLTLFQRVKASYVDRPGLSVTLRKAARLWDLDESVCRSVLETLIADGFLVCTNDAQYRRRTI